ncbi:MAG TPA: ABC transporter permease [Thermoflexus sp.]|nr:ABC transporter permease [Thermoflexus sp.]
MSKAHALVIPLSWGFLRILRLKVLPALVGLGVFMGLWWIATSMLEIAPRALFRSFSPQEAIPTFWQLMMSGTLVTHGLLSLRRVLIGLAIAITIGIPGGLVLGLSPEIERVMALPLQVLRTVSPLSWMPLAIILIGIGDSAVIFLIAISAIWPILFNTATGVRRLEPGWMLMARSVGARGLQIIGHVVLPAILPQIIGGIRLAVGLAWIVLVPAEMLGVTSGLGYFLLDTRDRLAYSELVATILAIGLIGLALDFGVRWAMTRLPGGNW